jgi:hypothetical protein
MKKLLSTLVLLLCTYFLCAQNIQFLYGYGNNKIVNFVTTEVYKSLDNGPIYYFTDFKINKDGYFESYSEISKYWGINKKGLSLTAQYNAGIGNDGDAAIKILPVYLAGLSQLITIKDFTLSWDVLYRFDKFTNTSGAQITFTFSRYWDKLQLSGYCDLWNSGIYDSNKGATVVLFEPQIFYKISKRFYVGVEGRLSNYTLLVPYDNYIMAGLKWNFEN